MMCFVITVLFYFAIIITVDISLMVLIKSIFVICLHFVFLFVCLSACPLISIQQMSVSQFKSNNTHPHLFSPYIRHRWKDKYNVNYEALKKINLIINSFLSYFISPLLTTIRVYLPSGKFSFNQTLNYYVTRNKKQIDTYVI